MDYTSSSASSAYSYASTAHSYASTSITRPPSYSTYSSPPAGSGGPLHSDVSSFNEAFATSQGQLGPLDLGPPGYRATITLFEGTPDEKTIYLGPWEIVGSEHRRVLWQGSYQAERLEHFLPSPIPSDTIPHTLHGLHRRFSDPYELERYVTFRDRHRVRYTSEDGQVIFDRPMEVKYEFTSLEFSWRFQGDLRRKDLVDCFDVDVVWTNNHGRTDSFGSVKGMGTGQRLKVWYDQYNASHSITMCANKIDRRYREYYTYNFEQDIRTRDRDDRRRHVKLATLDGRRGSAPEGRMTGLAAAFRQRQRSVGGGSGTGRSQDIRFLGIQFSRDEGKQPTWFCTILQLTKLLNCLILDYHRFFTTWAAVHASEGEFRGVAYPHDRFELPSPEMPPGTNLEYSHVDPYSGGGVQTLPETLDGLDVNDAQ